MPKCKGKSKQLELDSESLRAEIQHGIALLAQLDEEAEHEQKVQEPNRANNLKRLQIRRENVNRNTQKSKERYLQTRVDIARLKNQIARESNLLPEGVATTDALAEVLRRFDRLEAKLDRLVERTCQGQGTLVTAPKQESPSRSAKGVPRGEGRQFRQPVSPFAPRKDVPPRSEGRQFRQFMSPFAPRKDVPLQSEGRQSRQLEISNLRFRALRPKAALRLVRVENRGNGDREARPRSSKQPTPAPIYACFFISIPPQTKHRDGFGLRVNDPVFRDAALGIVAPLVNQISFRLLFAHHFQGEVGAQPETILPARIGGGKQQQKSGSRNLPGRIWSRNGAKTDFPTARLQRNRKNARNRNFKIALVLVRGHGKDFQEPVGELDQPVAVVGQNEILLLAPSTLGREYFLEHVLPLLVRTEVESSESVQSPWRFPWRNGFPSWTQYSKSLDRPPCEP